MGEIHHPAPALLLVAVTYRFDAAVVCASEWAIGNFGPVAYASETFDFTETDYYAATMGTNLKKKFFTFERLIDTGTLSDIKRNSNAWEAEYAALKWHVETRPVNIDPGYITPAKLVLASTKDHAHRIYLRDGIFAEVTLVYRQRKWQPLEWTYPDYRRDDYQQFFTECREWLLNCG
jgi:hypothetical protein